MEGIVQDAMNLKSEQVTIGRVKKQTVFLDIDDVILNSSEVVIEILNKRYNITPPKDCSNIKDWGFKSIVRSLNIKEVEEIFESDEFWDNVKVSEDFLNIWETHQLRTGYDWATVSVGTIDNLKKKEKFLSTYMDFRMEDEKVDIEDQYNRPIFYGIELNDWCSGEVEKNIIDMSNGIQIDDKYINLNTNAKLKVLLKNYNETTFNQVPEQREDLYIINNLKEFKEILLFNLDNGRML